jgi:hypothetical protein
MSKPAVPFHLTAHNGIGSGRNVGVDVRLVFLPLGPRYPAKLWWQEKFRLLLKEPGRSRNPVRRAGRSLFSV